MIENNSPEELSEEDEHVTVTCSVCGRAWSGSDVINKTQAYGCAAEAHDGDVLTGFYGSASIDMESWRLVGDVRLADGDLVCDDCVRGWQADGSLVPHGPSEERIAWTRDVREDADLMLRTFFAEDKDVARS